MSFFEPQYPKKKSLSSSMIKNIFLNWEKVPEDFDVDINRWFKTKFLSELHYWLVIDYKSLQSFIFLIVYVCDFACWQEIIRYFQFLFSFQGRVIFGVKRVWQLLQFPLWCKTFTSKTFPKHKTCRLGYLPYAFCTQGNFFHECAD